MSRTKLQIRNGYAVWIDKQTYPLRYAQFYRRILEGLERMGRRDIILVDVGCSIGHATYELKMFLKGRSYSATTIGIDIDHGLFKRGLYFRKN